MTTVPGRVDKLTVELSVAVKVIDGISVPGIKWSHAPSSFGTGRSAGRGNDMSGWDLLAAI